MRNNTVDDPDPRCDDVRGAWLEWLQPRRCVTVECTITGDFNEIEDDLNFYYCIINWFIDMTQAESL